MARVPYVLKRNTAKGCPSIYCRVEHYQNVTFDDVCRSASHVVHVPPALLKGYVQAVLDEAYLQVRRGLRVEIGDRCLSLYGQVQHSVKATIDKETGESIWPDEESIIPKGKDGRIECEVHKYLNKKFRCEVHWKRK